MADAPSIPTMFVGLVIPTKLLGTVYFDKSCVLQYFYSTWLGLVNFIKASVCCAHCRVEYLHSIKFF